MSQTQVELPFNERAETYAELAKAVPGVRLASELPTPSPALGRCGCCEARADVGGLLPMRPRPARAANTIT